MSRTTCLDSNHSKMWRVTSLPSFVDTKSKLASLPSLSPHPQRRGQGGLLTKERLYPEQNGYEDDLKPLVTVITVVFNDAKLLEQTILSVIKQTYDNIEYLIIDGGSTDGTLKVLQEYEHAIDYWVSEPDGGIYDAWNKGVRLSAGDWIAFLGAGDLYEKDAIQSYMDFIGNFKNCLPDYVSSRVRLVSAERTLMIFGKPWNWGDFRKYMNVAHVGSLHHRTLFERVGLYDTEYKICGDYELLLRPQSDLQAVFLNQVTAIMNSDGVSNQDSRVFEETLKAKICSGGRGQFASELEKIWGILKWKVRNILWRL